VAISQTIFITKSVGAGGANLSPDVKAVQKQLNDQMPPSRTKLSVDGRCGPLTIGCIKEFQKEVLGKQLPDGRVDPGFGTLAALNDPNSASKWAKMSFGAPAVPGVGSGSTIPNEAAMQQKFNEAGRAGEWNEFRRALVDGSIPGMKTFLGLLGRAEDAQKLASAVLALRRMGLTFEEIRLVLRAATGMRKQKAALELFEDLSKPVSKFGKLLGAAAGFAGKVGLLVTVIEVADKFADGDYLYGASEVYKNFMGKAIPWAGMLEGLQSLVEGILPDNAKTAAVFNVIRACDPIGLGGAAVDAVTSLALGAIDMVLNRKMGIDAMMPRLHRLNARLKQGPTKFFADMGENLGDAMYELSNWRREDWSYAVTTIPGWIASAFQ
jgi:hypothetical protein